MSKPNVTVEPQPAAAIEKSVAKKANKAPATPKTIPVDKLRELVFVDKTGRTYMLDDYRPGDIFILRPVTVKQK